MEHFPFFEIARDRGVFVHANHCLDARVRLHEAERLPSPGSPGRCNRLESLLAAASGRIDVEAIQGMLADHTGMPEPLCRHAARATEWETASALIAEPASRTLHLSYGPPCQGRFATYRIS